MSGMEEIDEEKVYNWDKFLKKGSEIPDTRIDELCSTLQPDDIATLVYTSGTTNPPPILGPLVTCLDI